MRGRFLLAALGLLLWVAPAQANYWEGFGAFKRGDYRTAYQEFNRLAELGHAASQFNLGYLHHHGLAVPRNPAAAARWYRAAAEQGRVEAQFSLGTLYETGSGVPRDLAEAYRWYNLAASNVPPGKGRDSLIKHRKRVSFQLTARLRGAVEAAPAPSGFTLGADLAAAAEQPALEAPPVRDLQRELAARKFNPGPIDGQMGRSTIGALSAFQASSGLAVTGELDPPTLNKLFGPEEVAPHLEPFPRAAQVFKDPSPPAVPVPPVEQVELAPEKAPVQVAEAPAPIAAEQPAQAVEESAEAPEETQTAAATVQPEAGPQGLDALRRDAQQGDATAQINLATMYHYGQGIAEDREEAMKWYLLAAEQGRVDAMFPLASLYESGAREPQDLVAAHKWYSLAAEKVPSGKAHEIIVKRRDRVAQQLTPELLASAEATTAPGETEPEVPTLDQPVEAAPANRPPRGLVFTLLSGATAARASVAENVKNGTVIGAVGATDPDPGEVLTYELKDDAGGRFDIDPETGKLVVVDGARLDFEETASHDVVVRVTDSGGHTYDEVLAVTVTDLNEAPAAAAATFAVAENAAGGTVLGQINALDLDGGANGRLTFALADDGPFVVDPATGEVTVAEGARLDFEAQPQFELAAIVTDGGGLSAGAAVTVRLKNRNEAPHGIVMAAGGTVSEGVPAGTVVGRVAASDPDQKDHLTYSLAGDAGGRFAIDRKTGTITVADGAELDFEQSPGHEVTVRATDSGGLFHEGAVAIAVSDANEAPWAKAETFSVAENAPEGTEIGRVSAGDPDSGANGKLRYAITGGGNQFAIDPETGQLSVAGGAELDFEASAALELTVRVSDGNGLSDAALVTVEIRDGNEPPEDLTLLGGIVAESAKGGTLVAELSARDPDAGESLSYSLSEDAGGRFAIDPRTGAISVAEGARFDYDEAASHEIGVTVTDAGGLSYSERLTVAVTDENLAPTAVALSDGRVAENAEAGTLVARISASDPDAGERVTYRLAEDADGRFVIDPETGAISVAEGARFDFEAEASHQLKVQVTGSGGASYEEALAIVVTDANEVPSLQAVSFNLDETAGPGTAVGRLAARDPDRGSYGALRYAITGDNSNGRFAIDPVTGAISVAEGAKLDFEDRRSFKLEVTAIDGGGFSDSALVAIDLVDRNEAPTGLRLISSKVPENAAGGTFAGQVAALDPDAGDIVTYRLIEDAEGRFVIDFGTGVITVAKGAKLDFEAAEHHRLAVRVTDSGSLTYDEAFSVSLTDVNEPPTVPAASLRVAENAASGTLVGRLGAVDPDAGDRLAYGLRDNAGDRFAIDKDTGAVMVADGAGLDFEQRSSFEITATVSDSGGLKTSVEVTVEIADLNERPGGDVMIEGTVAENAAPGTLAAAYRATDPDAGDRVSYSLARNSGGRFSIDSASGLITVARGAKFDFEQAAEHEVTVRATDKAGLAHSETLTIAVLEVVEEQPLAKQDLLTQYAAAPLVEPDSDRGSTASDAKGRPANGNRTNGNATIGGSANGIGPHETATNGQRDGGQADRGRVLEAVVAADNKLQDIAGKGPGTVNRVAALQAQLLEAGFNPGPVDGKMGPKTRAAMSEYQKAFKLTELRDDELWAHLLVRAHFQRGYSFQAQGDHEKSIAEYAEVVRLDPDYYIAYYNRGLIHYNEGRYGRAAEDFAKVIEARPDYAGAYINRGNAYYRQGLYARAADDYLTAIGHWVWPW